jgi:hypothetical protein
MPFDFCHYLTKMYLFVTVLFVTFSSIQYDSEYLSVAYMLAAEKEIVALGPLPLTDKS